MRRKMAHMLVLLFALGLLTAQSGFAAIFKYVDTDGMMYFADNLQSIPEQYRASAKIVSGEATEGEEKQSPVLNPSPVKTETKAGGVVSTVAQALHLSSESGEKGAFGNRALLSAIIVVSAIFAFVILDIVNADHEKTVKIARVVILWGVSVFLLYNHAKDAVHVFSMMGSTVTDARQESAEKGAKAARAIKRFSELAEQTEKAAYPDTPEPAQEKKE